LRYLIKHYSTLQIGKCFQCHRIQYRKASAQTSTWLDAIINISDHLPVADVQSHGIADERAPKYKC